MDVAPRQAPNQPRRPSIWALLFTSVRLWATFLFLLPLAAAAPFVTSSGTGAGIVSAVLVGLVLLSAGWQIYVLFELSKRGVIAQGSLVCEEIISTARYQDYKATYQFEIEGQQLTCKEIYDLGRSVRHDVLVLFDPKRPKGAYILPRIFG